MSNDTWATPQEIFNALDMEFGFGFDVCAEVQTAKCYGYWTAEDDALSKNWAEEVCGLEAMVYGKWLFCNPPYSNIGPWVDKAIQAQCNGRGVVMLCMCDPSVKWFSKALQFASEIRFITNGRISFLRDGVKAAGNNKGSVIFVFDPHRVSAGHTSYIDRDQLLEKGQINMEVKVA